MIKIKRIFGFIIFVFLFSAVHTAGQPKIYLVRHSEKIEDWQKNIEDFQPLNSKGMETSKRLTEYFNKINLSAIYSSPVTRTLQTVYYVSKKKKLKIKIEDACNDTSLINSFIKTLNKTFSSKESVLIVSHSDVIPYFLIKLGLKEKDYNIMDFTKPEDSLLTDYYGEVFIIEQMNSSNKIYREKF